MRLVGGSPISDKELWACAALMLKRYGDDARNEINRRIDAMNVNGDLAGHATWVNISLCLIAMTTRDENEAKN